MPEQKAGMSVSITVEGLSALLEKIPDQAKRRQVEHALLRRIGLRIEAKAKSLAPVKTGNLRRSINTIAIPGVGSGAGRWVGAIVHVDARYGPFVEFGTGLHGPSGARIHPKSKKVMAWHGGVTGPSGNLRLTGKTRAGKVTSMVFARSTQGMHPHPFFHPAWAHVEANEVAVEIAKAAAALMKPGTDAGAAT